MISIRRALLTVDAIVNLILGLTLLLYPSGLIRFLGLPPTDTSFYITILGGVLVGIGAALILGLRDVPRRTDGLGLRGAVAINLCGAGVLLAWLLFADLSLEPRGWVLLWCVALVVLGLGVVELIWSRTSSGR